MRRPSRPCSGRGASGSVVSHFGPPTAPSRTASAARQAASTSSVRAVPCSSIEQPADQALVELELAERLEQAAGGGDDLGADPVAGQDDYAGCVAHRRGTLRMRVAGLDVEADVVEGQRARLRAPRTSATKGLAELLGQPVEVRAEADGAQELGRLRRDDRPRAAASSATSAKPAARSRASVSSGAGVVPGLARSPRSGRRRARGRRPRSLIVAAARRCCRRRRTGRPAARRGLSAAAHAAEERVVIEDPVEDGAREDDVDRLVQLELGQVGDEAPRRCGRRASRTFSTIEARAVDGDDAALAAGARSASR